MHVFVYFRLCKSGKVLFVLLLEVNDGATVHIDFCTTFQLGNIIRRHFILDFQTERYSIFVINHSIKVKRILLTQHFLKKIDKGPCVVFQKSHFHILTEA